MNHSFLPVLLILACCAQGCVTGGKAPSDLPPLAAADVPAEVVLLPPVIYMTERGFISTDTAAPGASAEAESLLGDLLVDELSDQVKITRINRADLTDAQFTRIRAHAHLAGRVRIAHALVRRQAAWRDASGRPVIGPGLREFTEPGQRYALLARAAHSAESPEVTGTLIAITLLSPVATVPLGTKSALHLSLVEVDTGQVVWAGDASGSYSGATGRFGLSRLVNVATMRWPGGSEP